MTSRPYFKNPDNMPHRTTDKDGREVYVYPSGMVKDAKTGYLIWPSREGGITKDNWPEYLQRKKELHQQAAEEGIIQALQENKKFNLVQTSSDAIRVIAKLMTRIALNSPHDRDKLDAMEKVVKMADMLPRDVVENQTNILNIDPQTAKMIVSLVQQLAGAEVVDAEVVDVKELQDGKKWV